MKTDTIQNVNQRCANSANESIPLDKDQITAPKENRKSPIRWDRRKFALKIGSIRTSGWRLIVQSLFALLTLAIGWQFIRFVQAASETSSGSLPLRPPGVEGFLPISGLMGLVDWVYQGTLNSIHPAATALFIIFVLMSLIIRKSFCGWVCPGGFVSENLARLGQLMFQRNFRLPKWLDIGLRGLKYLILGFFVWAISGMTTEVLHDFIQSPYNKISDVKMLGFFVHLSMAGMVVILLLVVLSILVHSFWCRYLCPYGALMGLVSWMSSLKIKRDPNLCTDCGICDKACPARLPVSQKLRIISSECIGCTDCVTSCPVPDALNSKIGRKKLNPRRIGSAVAIMFIAGYILFRSAGLWQNNLSDDEVRYHMQRMNSPEYTHPGR